MFMHAHTRVPVCVSVSIEPAQNGQLYSDLWFGSSYIISFPSRCSTGILQLRAQKDHGDCPE